MNRNKIAMAAIHQLQKRLQDAPEYRVNEVSMVRAIQLLASDIRAMKAKGYTMDQIAKMLTNSGIPINATTLKSYLSRFTMVPPVKPLRKHRGGAIDHRVTIGAIPEYNQEPTRNSLARVTARFAHRDRPFRSIVIGRSAHRDRRGHDDRSEATRASFMSACPSSCSNPPSFARAP
jgi:hypothetical protein